MTKVRWGVLSTAKIGVEKVIPAMQQGQYSEIVAISSRSLAKAQTVAQRLGIPKAYGSYAEMLTDPDIDAVYNPTPNHLHAPLTLDALKAGKHVLCEKPITLNAAEARRLQREARKYPHLKVMEAFMYRFHPQWRLAKRLVDEGAIGELRTIHTHFSYYNDNPNDVRNKPEWGGGGLMDIGCYAINLSRFIFGDEPDRVLGVLEYDSEYGVDRRASGILDFMMGTATFTVGTQLAPYQRVHIMADLGRIEIEIPFNTPGDRAARLWVTRKGETEEILIPAANQYTLQGDAFSKAILDDAPAPTPLEDAVANMTIIDALIISNERDQWVHPNLAR
jgi:predicted dehydrogenase